MSGCVLAAARDEARGKNDARCSYLMNKNFQLSGTLLLLPEDSSSFEGLLVWFQSMPRSFSNTLLRKETPLILASGSSPFCTLQVC